MPSAIQFKQNEILSSTKMNALANSIPSVDQLNASLGKDSNIFLAKILGPSRMSGWELWSPWEEISYYTTTGMSGSDPSTFTFIDGGSGEVIPKGQRYATSNADLWALSSDNVYHHSGDIVLMTYQTVSGIARYICVSNPDPPLPTPSGIDDSGTYIRTVQIKYTSGVDYDGSFYSGYMYFYSWQQTTNCPV